jgi:hypothetical protein
MLKKEKIHIALDTAGVGTGNYEEILKYVDLVIFDVKHISSEGYKDLTGGDMTEIFDFLLAANKMNKKFWIRQVIVPGIMDNEEYLVKLSNFLKTNIISTNIVDFGGSTQLSGLVLVIIAFLSIIIISIFIPNTVPKWEIIAPVYVPLLLRSNISPAFTQTLFIAADSIGKLFSPIYIYLIVAIGFMHKYEKDSNISIIGTMKKAMPSILLLSLVWVIIIFGWYLIGLPIGINSLITL